MTGSLRTASASTEAEPLGWSQQLLWFACPTLASDTFGATTASAPSDALAAAAAAAVTVLAVATAAGCIAASGPCQAASQSAPPACLRSGRRDMPRRQQAWRPKQGMAAWYPAAGERGSPVQWQRQSRAVAAEAVGWR